MKMNIESGKLLNGKAAGFIVYGLFQNELQKLSSYIPDKMTRKKAEELLTKKKFTGKTGQNQIVDCVHCQCQSNAILLVGLGNRNKYTLQTARLLAAKACRQAECLGFEAVTVYLDSLKEKFSPAEIAAALTEGAMLSAYSFDKYKSEAPTKFKVKQCIVWTNEVSAISKIRQSMRAAEITA